MKIYVIQQKTAALLAGLLAVCAIFYVVSYPSAVSALATKRQLPIYCVQKDQKVCSVSFDAAWGNEDTQTLIDILGRYKVKATFFVVGAWAEKYPESVRALSEAGHEVMNHSNDHAHFNSLSAEEIAQNVTACNQKVEAITGVSPSLIRCPYGEYDDHVVSAIRALGMEPIQWDVDSLDWKELPATDICRRVLSKVQPGSIVLFHNAAKHTPEALPAILEKLISDGYTLVPISQLICKGSCGSDYTIDHSGRQFAVQPPAGETLPAEKKSAQAEGSAAWPNGAAQGGASAHAPTQTDGARGNAA